MEESSAAVRPLFTRRELFRLIWPLIIEQTLAIAVGMADSVMVSSVGEAAISGVSLVDMISVLLINVFAALATGGAVVTSQFLGARDGRSARESADQLMLITLVLSCVITAVVLAFRQRLLTLAFGDVEPDVMANCLTYIAITGFSYPFIALYNSAAALFRSLNNSRVSMLVSLAMNAINVVGNATLVYGFRLGVAGVAIPTLVSRAFAAVVMLLLLRKKNNPVRIGANGKLRFNRGMSRRILTIGIPSAVENGMFQFGKILVISMIAGFGTAQIAANAMGNNIAALSILTGQALALAIVTVVGRCVGAQDLRQAKRYGLNLTLLSDLLTTLACGLVVLVLPLLLRLYSASPEASHYVRVVIWMHAATVPLLWSWSFVLPGALRACNDVKFTSAAAIASMWIVRVGGSYLLGVRLGWGVVGVWAAMLIDWVVRAAFYVPRFFTGGWKKHAIYTPVAHHRDI